MEISLVRPVVGGRVSQWFGTNPEAYARFGLAGHNGIDYAVISGTPVRAAHDGVLRIAAVDPSGYGLYCVVDGEKFSTLYAHLAGVIAAEGEVRAGQPIAVSGNTGNSTGPHLHFGLKVTGLRNPAYRNYIDPAPFRDI
jgi:murein DD-endopeptidase MepM/ murein hydrolase activator NlpD